jgi:hypothetical protein
MILIKGGKQMSGSKGEQKMNMPSRYWEPSIEYMEPSEEQIIEAENEIKENGIPYDDNLPFN